MYRNGNDPTSQYSAVIPIFIRCALEGRAPTIYGAGEQTRDFTYVENVVRATLLACHAQGPGLAGEVFNVGCGERVSVNRLWQTSREVTVTDVEAEHGPPRPGDVRHSLAGLEDEELEGNQSTLLRSWHAFFHDRDI